MPLGGALFALEVMRGVLALRYVLPALFASVVATAVSWVALPDAPTYLIPAYQMCIRDSFYPFVAKALTGENHLGPYTVYFVFALGALASNFPLNYAFMRRPVSGSRCV